MTTLAAITASSFINSLGINTHIDFDNYGYQNLSTVESSIEYLGVKNVRDSAQNSSDITTWDEVAQATGVKFDDYMPEGSPAAMQNALSLVPQLAQEGILNFVEGGNEEDDSYAASQGNTLAYTAQFQQQVYAMGQEYGLGVINMSFGAGWTAANNWEGDYPNVGNLSNVANYANAHTYPNPGQNPDYSIQQLNADAKLAASSDPVITTEIGWDGNTFTNESQVAQYVVEAALDGIKDGDVKMYYYALFNDSSGNFGLMNQNGTPTLAGTALHDLTTLLADTGANAATFTPGSLSFTLSGNQSTDNTLLIQKSDGSDWLALWDETAGTHNVTLTLGSTAAQIVVFDPVTGTSSIQSASNTNTISVSLSNDPLLIEVINAGSSASSTTGSSGSTTTTGSSGGSTTTTTTTTTTTPDPVVTVPAAASVAENGTVAITGVSISDPWGASNPGSLTLTVSASNGDVTMLNSSGSKLAGSGTGTIQVSGTLAQINAELATLSYTAGTTSGTIDVDIWDQAGVEGNKSFEVTATASTSTGSSSSSSGNSSSSTGTSSTGTTTTTTSSSSGPVPNPVVTVPTSETVAASSTVAVSGVSVSDPWAATAPGTLALNVTATDGSVTMLGSNGSAVTGSGTSAIHVSGTLSQINAELATLSYTAGSATGTGSVTVDIWDQGGVEATKSVAVTIDKPVTTITIAASNADPVETASNAVITASSGDHMIFLQGTGDTLTATGGTETVQAYQGGNTITTGTGNDTIRFAGSDNVVNAGAGSNRLLDSGSNNTLVLGASGGYDDIYGYVMTNGDKFDLRSLLAQTSWNGDLASIGNFLKVATSGNNGTLTVNPTGTTGGASHLVATFESSGAMNLSTLLAHAIT